MRLLFITRQFVHNPSDQFSGIYKRMGMFIDAFKEIVRLDILFYISDNIRYSPSQCAILEKNLSKFWKMETKIFLCPISKFRDDTSLSKWLSYSAGIYNFYNQRYYFELSGHQRIQALEECLDLKPDAIFAKKLYSMCPLRRIRKPLPPIFFDLDDIEHRVFMRFVGNVNLPNKLLLLQLPSLCWAEYKAIKLATKTFVCSEVDQSYLAKKFNLRKIVVIPNAVDIPNLQPLTTEPTLLFLGRGFTQNIDAAKYLAVKIWPHIHKRIPFARLIIAGMPARQLNLNINGIHGIDLPGFVENLDELYRRSRVITAPILVCGGTRYKIIEAAAYGKPVVSTTIGAEGLGFENETEILIRDNPGDFAEACIKLLNNPDLCEKIGLRARFKIKNQYDKSQIVRLIRQQFINLMACK